MAAGRLSGQQLPAADGTLIANGPHLRLAEPAGDDMFPEASYDDIKTPAANQQESFYERRDSATEKESARSKSSIRLDKPSPTVSLLRTVEVFKPPNKLLPERSSLTSLGGSDHNGTSKEIYFDEDLREWVWEVSEHFHGKIFFIELVGQLLYTFFGPLVWPLLMLLYGSRAALINRSFYPRPDGSNIPFIVGILFWIGLMLAGFAWVSKRPEDITDVELKYVFLMVMMRNLTVSFKYAFMTTRQWRSLNVELKDVPYLQSLLLIGGWIEVSEKQMMKFAEMSFIGVLGSRYQRDSLFFRFMAWPRTREDLTSLRHRVDGTTKSLYHLPVGKILRASTPFRKAATVVNSFTGEHDLHAWCRLHMAATAAATAKHPSNSKKDDIEEHDHVDMEKAKCKQLVLADSVSAKAVPIAKEDAQLFEQAMHGEMVALTDLFLFMVRSTLRAERALISNRRVQQGCMLVSILMLLLPCLLRAAVGKQFFGENWASTMIIVGPWPSNLIAFWGNNLFIYIAAKDMWRRRSLMRSCAAMLTFQRKYREHCPAEVDCLPVVDMHDVNTIEAWRKLRQLCRDWGQFFFWRIQAFTSAFLVCVVISLADFVATLTVPELTKARHVSLLHFFMVLIPAGLVLICIIVQVVLGHEVNSSADRHVNLLHRQRLVFMSAKQRAAADAAMRGEEVPDNNESLQRSIDFLDCLCDSIEAEHKADPITLVGMYCGYSLLSALYFLPLGVFTTLFNFCAASETAWRCTTWFQ